MYVAVNNKGERIIPFEYGDKRIIRTLSQSRKVFCPECGNRVVFHSGSRKMEHFKHWRLDKCENENEPETVEHIKGKIMIYDYLKKMYPEALVELEYKIIETGQRADVMCIHPNGERWAFEMQCSEILGDAWLSRHLRYKEAGIKDYWILGESVHRVGRTSNQHNEYKHKFVSLALDIYMRHEAVYFLNVETGSVRLLYKINSKPYYNANTIFIIDNISDDLLNLFPYKHYMVNEEYKEKIMAAEEAERRYRDEQKRLKRESEEREIRLEKIASHRNKLADEYAHSFKKYIIESPLSRVLDNIQRGKDKKLFEYLLKKHKLNDESFPGFLRIWTPCGHLIQSPPHLWQLWIFDKYIYNTLDYKPNSKVWLPKIKDEMYKTFPTLWEEDTHFSFAIWDFFTRLESINMIAPLSFDGKYRRILVDTLPSINDKEINIKISIALSFGNDTLRTKEPNERSNSDNSNELIEYVQIFEDESKKRKEEKQNEKSTTEHYKQVIEFLFGCVHQDCCLGTFVLI